MSNLQRNLMKSRLPPPVPRAAKNMAGRQKDYSPTQWSEYFHDFVDVAVDDKSSFRCYRSQPADTPDAPVLVLLHGGGYNALSWACFSVSFNSQFSIKHQLVHLYRLRLCELFTASA